MRSIFFLSFIQIFIIQLIELVSEKWYVWVQIDSIETFLRLNSDGLDVFNDSVMNEMSQDRQLLTKALWVQRDKLRRFYKELAEYNNAFRPFEICRDGFVFKLDDSEVAMIRGYGLDLKFERTLR